MIQLPDLAAMPRWRRFLVVALVGGLIGLGQAPFSLFWISLPALVAAFWVFQDSETRKQAFWRGWALGAGYAVVTMFWIVEPFMVDFARHGILSPFALGAMAGGFGLFWGAGFALAKWLAPKQFGPAALVVAWTAVEILRSYLFTGFPWALVSYIWIDTPVAQLAAFLGPHGLTLLTLALIAAAVSFRSKPTRFVALGGVVLALVAAWGFGSWIENSPVPSDGTERPIVRLIQPNASQHQKWDPAMMPIFYNRQVGLTAEVAEPAPDMVVWPEVAVPFLLGDETAPFWEIAGAAGEATVILGAQRLIGSKAYNSVAVLDQDGGVTQVYDKYHLVPFGEYLPFGEAMNEWGLQALTAQYGYGYSKGSGPGILDLGEFGKALPLICYESVFPHEMRHAPERPDWLLLLTNDAWFGKLSGPYQHLAQAQARSIEFGLPMVRVANTGVSAMIDARGKIVGQIPLGVSGRIDLPLPPPLPPTIYAKFGDWTVMTFLIFCLAVLTVRSRKYSLTTE